MYVSPSTTTTTQPRVSLCSLTTTTTITTTSPLSPPFNTQQHDNHRHTKDRLISSDED
jgi:hypothetical protein